jgi:hypothetical protein
MRRSSVDRGGLKSTLDRFLGARESDPAVKAIQRRFPLFIRWEVDADRVPTSR